MSPGEFERWYHALWVANPVSDSYLQVDIWKYLMGGQSGAYTEASIVRDGARRADPTAYIDAGATVRAFTGKGSPEDISHTLYLALLAKKVKADNTSLQQYANNWLGVDCTGFTSAYLVYEGKLNAPVHHLPTFFSRKARLRMTLAEVQSGDLVIWWDVRANREAKPAGSSVGHAVLIETNYQSGLFDTVESAGFNFGKGAVGPMTSGFTLPEKDGVDEVGQWQLKRLRPTPGTGYSKVAIIDPY